MYWFANAGTEFLDMIGVAFDALPNHCKPGMRLRQTNEGAEYVRTYKPSTKQRIGAVYKCWNQMNVPQFLAGVVTNQIEDRAFGQIGQMSNQASRAGGAHGSSGMGFQFGDWDTAPLEYAGGVMKKEREQKREAAAEAEHQRKRNAIVRG
jgi:hypothetical protein